MGILDGILRQLATGDTVHDYRHANKIFASDGFRSAPKHQFLFYVRVKLNSTLSQDTVYPSLRVNEVGSLCKTCELPKFAIENKLGNAYNRPQLVTTKVKYQDVRFTFHDDADDNLVDLWYNYYSYYFRDSDYNDSVYQNIDRYTTRQATKWGYQPATVWDNYQNIIEKIDIFSFHNNRFTQYALINPRIQSWTQSQHDMAQGSGIMEHQVTIAYESVKYYKGYVTPDLFPDMMLRYDRTPSPLSPAGGGTVSILGPGGAIESVGSITKDLASGNWAGAALKIARASQTWKGANLGAVIAGEGVQVVKDIISGNNPLSRVQLPSLSGLTNSIGVGGSVAGAASTLGGLLGSPSNAFASQTSTFASLGLNKATTASGGSALLTAAQQVSSVLTSNGGAVAKAASSAITQVASALPSFPKNFSLF